LSSQSLAAILAVILAGIFCLTTLHTSWRRLQKKESKKSLNVAKKLLFYQPLCNVFFHPPRSEDLHSAIIFTQQVLRFAYVVLALALIADIQLFTQYIDPQTQTCTFSLQQPVSVFGWIGLFLLLLLIGEFAGRLLGTRYPERTLAWTAPIAACFMTLLFPLIFVLLKIFHLLPRHYFDTGHESSQEAKQELIEMIEESDLNTHLDPHDKKLIEAVMGFKDRIAREIMVPRVDIFSLPYDTPIEDAATLIYKEGYSRTPVYQDTLDNIIGVLMYKDVLAKYMEHLSKGDRTVLQSPISTLVKNVLYTPETKKISHLLQEFRKQQVHLAIIVDEYGGTEGIITIEDILEEIVGDIADEYDQEEALFVSLPEGGWLIDARMSIFDIEEQLGIAIPQHGDYDTMGGYIFHETGMIPPKGFTIKKPHFELEVIRSNSRRVEKLRIKSLSLLSDDDEAGYADA